MDEKYLKVEVDESCKASRSGFVVVVIEGRGWWSYEVPLASLVSRRPELDKKSVKDFLMQYKCKYTVTDEGAGLPLVDQLTPADDSTIKFGLMEIDHMTEEICSKFTAPEAKQREVKWPEKDCLPLELQHHKESGLFNEIRNSAIDACKKAYEEAQPSSSVNAEVVEALRGLVDDEECSFDHHGYCQTHFSGSMPCLMEKARKALKKVGYD